MSSRLDQSTEERQRNTRTLVVIVAIVVLVLLVLLLFGPMLAPDRPSRGERTRFRGGHERTNTARLSTELEAKADGKQEIRASSLGGG